MGRLRQQSSLLSCSYDTVWCHKEAPASYSIRPTVSTADAWPLLADCSSIDRLLAFLSGDIR
jgi:hypothetical protein